MTNLPRKNALIMTGKAAKEGRYFGDSTVSLRSKEEISADPQIIDENNSARIVDYDNLETLWWLRTQGVDDNCAAIVSDDGSINLEGIEVDKNYGGVRPALWLNL